MAALTRLGRTYGSRIELNHLARRIADVFVPWYCVAILKVVPQGCQCHVH